jgi:hypothetical protein
MIFLFFYEFKLIKKNSNGLSFKIGSNKITHRNLTRADFEQSKLYFRRPRAIAHGNSYVKAALSNMDRVILINQDSDQRTTLTKLQNVLCFTMTDFLFFPTSVFCVSR